MVSGAIWFRPGKSDSHAALVPQGAARSVVSRRTLTKAPTRLGDGPSFETRWLSHRSYRHEAVELAPVVAGITLGVTSDPHCWRLLLAVIADRLGAAGKKPEPAKVGSSLGRANPPPPLSFAARMFAVSRAGTGRPHVVSSGKQDATTGFRNGKKLSRRFHPGTIRPSTRQLAWSLCGWPGRPKLRLKEVRTKPDCILIWGVRQTSRERSHNL